jgi:hypothetical protein
LFSIRRGGLERTDKLELTLFSIRRGGLERTDWLEQIDRLEQNINKSSTKVK